MSTLISTSSPEPAPASSQAAPPASPAPRANRAWLATSLPIYLAIVAIWIYFDTQTSGRFVGARNLSEMFQEFSYKPLLAIGVVFVLLLGEIDLSVGYLTLLAATCVAVFSATLHQSAVVSIVAGIVVAVALGLTQGFLISFVRMPAFVVTLGGFLIFEGIAYHILSGATINVSDPTIGLLGTAYLPPWVSWLIVGVAIAMSLVTGIAERRQRERTRLVVPRLGKTLVRTAVVGGILALIVAYLDSYRGVPLVLAIFGFFVVVASFILTRTRFGRHVFAVGGNVEASRRAGIRTISLRWIVFGISGLFAGIAGVLLVGYAQAASTTAAGPDLLLDAISIAVIGGVSLTGGRGSVPSVLLGGLLIASLDSGLNLMSIDSNLVYVIKGVILLVAIFLDVLGKRRTSPARL